VLEIKRIKEKLSKSKLFKDSFWALFGNSFNKIINLLIGIVIANLLGSDEYGQYGMIKSTLIYLSVFSTFGLGITGTKYIAKYSSENPSVVNGVYRDITTITLYTSAFIALIVLIFANPIAVFVNAPWMTNIFRISSIAIVFNAINNTQVGQLGGFKKYKMISNNQIFTAIFNCIIGLSFTYLWGLKGAVIAICLTYIFNFLINERLLRKIRSEYPTAPKSFSMKKEMIYFSLPIALQEGLQSIAGWATIAVLVKLSSYSELGIYSASSQWIAAISFIPHVLRNVTLSHLSDSNSDHKKIIKIMLLVNFSVTIVMFLAIFLFSGLIARGYGESFKGLNTVLSILTFSSVIGCMGSVFIQELIAISKNWIVFSISFGKSLLIIVFGVYFILGLHLGGAMSFALSTLIANIIYLLSLFVSYRVYAR
jgi:O-antigen/teichoic acid export membrane protein